MDAQTDRELSIGNLGQETEGRGNPKSVGDIERRCYRSMETVLVRFPIVIGAYIRRAKSSMYHVMRSSIPNGELMT